MLEGSQAATITHSFARISFVLGAPLTTTTRSSRARDSGTQTLKWQCGCSSMGPFRSMLWHPCASHAPYTAVLDEEKTSSLVATWSELGEMRFGPHSATWTFDPANLYHEKRLRDEYVSILYACGSLSGDFFAAEMIYRELIGNALRHAPGTVTVELHWRERYPVLNVHDGSGLFLWTGDLPHNPWSERGRGLYIVHSLARELRIKDSLGAGWKVSAVLPVERKSNVDDLFDFPPG